MTAYRLDRINCRIPIEIGKWPDYLAPFVIAQIAAQPFALDRAIQIRQLRAQRTRRHCAYRFILFFGFLNLLSETYI